MVLIQVLLQNKYIDTSDGSVKDEGYSTSTPSNTTHHSGSGSRVHDMIQSESQSMIQQDSSQSTQTTTDHVKSTIQEFKVHELKSQEENKE